MLNQRIIGGKNWRIFITANSYLKSARGKAIKRIHEHDRQWVSTRRDHVTGYQAHDSNMILDVV